MKKLVSISLLVASIATAFSDDAHLAFRGTCNLDSKVIGTFELDHGDALKGNCPHALLDFSVTNTSGVESKYQVYIEHQDFTSDGKNQDYAGIYLFKGTQMNDFVAGAENQVNISQGDLLLEVELEGRYLTCSGEVK